MSGTILPDGVEVAEQLKELQQASQEASISVEEFNKIFTILCDNMREKYKNTLELLEDN